MTETSPAVDAIRSVIADLAAIPDPADRARAVGAVLDAVPALQAELRATRQAAVIELRGTRSLAEVAGVLGISVPRVSQIASGVSRNARK
ncbi:RNA polymerase subunit sigma-70 [Streptomyces sp. NBC_01351]|uniref:RNA polymerase subunit sigma-70 n=1 Tax=Streptomyces sp. NBC_01351 TaxID=2903833 RepID=UPI002E36D86F|nr:RNA polymerase subunit sigma-70 [Streptomyces sp. NBC_01351]